MTLTYTPHEKISLKRHGEFNEAWLHDRIADDPTMLGLGDVRVLDRERSHNGAGRLDMLLQNDEENRRYEVEIMLGSTDPSHIIRTIEYWDIERRRYPGYDHVAVLIAEDITARFLNVIGLLAGSIPIVAIQLDALRVGDNILLNFVQVLDQTELRVDDTEEDSGGGQVDRSHWEQKATPQLLRVCDRVLSIINDNGNYRQELNYLRGYIGLRCNGVVRNFIFMAPKHTKNIVHIFFLFTKRQEWMERFDEAGLTAQPKGGRRLRITVTPQQFEEHEGLLKEAIAAAVEEYEQS